MPYFFSGLPKNSHLHAPAFAIKQRKKDKKNESRLAPTLNFSVLAIDNMVQEVVASLTTREIVWFWIYNCPDY